MKKFFAAILLILLASFSAFAAANETDDGSSIGPSGLPLPRFASLRFGDVNMRTGPGTRYPIEWVLEKQGLPVEIIAEYEYWRRVRDPDGDEGWVHKSALAGRRGAVVTGAYNLHRDGQAASPVMAHLERGAVGQLLGCGREWCKLKFGDVQGYLPKTDFWGAFRDETFD